MSICWATPQRPERLTLARSQRTNETSSIVRSARPRTACVASSSVAVNLFRGTVRPQQKRFVCSRRQRDGSALFPPCTQRPCLWCQDRRRKHGIAEVEQELTEEAQRSGRRLHHRRAPEADHGVQGHHARQSRRVVSLGERMESVAIAINDIPGLRHFSLEGGIVNVSPTPQAETSKPRPRRTSSRPLPRMDEACRSSSSKVPRSVRAQGDGLPRALRGYADYLSF